MPDIDYGRATRSPLILLFFAYCFVNRLSDIDDSNNVARPKTELTLKPPNYYGDPRALHT